MTRDGSAGLVEVDEDRDRVRIAVPARDIAIGASHRAAVRSRRCNEVSAAAVCAHGERLFDPEYQDVALDTQPVLGRSLIAMQVRDLPMGRDFVRMYLWLMTQDLRASRIAPNSRLDSCLGRAINALRPALHSPAIHTLDLVSGLD